MKNCGLPSRFIFRIPYPGSSFPFFVIRGCLCFCACQFVRSFVHLTCVIRSVISSFFMLSKFVYVGTIFRCRIAILVHRYSFV